MAGRDRVGATQNIERTPREFLADSEWNNRVSERKWRGQCQAATGPCTGNVCDHGLFADSVLPWTGECRLRGHGASFQRPVRGHIPAFHPFMRWPVDRQLSVAFGCRWRAARGHKPKQRAATDSNM
jgi:hypothetical protein